MTDPSCKEKVPGRGTCGGVDAHAFGCWRNDLRDEDDRREAERWLDGVKPRYSHYDMVKAYIAGKWAWRKNAKG